MFLALVVLFAIWTMHEVVRAIIRSVGNITEDDMRQYGGGIIVLVLMAFVFSVAYSFLVPPFVIYFMLESYLEIGFGFTYVEYIIMIGLFHIFLKTDLTSIHKKLDKR